MVSSAAGPDLTLITSPAWAVETDILFLPAFEGEEPAGFLEGLPEAVAQALTRALDGREFQGKPFDIFVLPFPAGSWRAQRLGLIGCGGLPVPRRYMDGSIGSPVSPS
jgi:hypothetical protein